VSPLNHEQTPLRVEDDSTSARLLQGGHWASVPRPDTRPGLGAACPINHPDTL
jgi:hypothetical protein